MQDSFSNQCSQNSKRLLVKSDYFTTHSSAKIYIMPRLDTNFDNTAQKISQLENEVLKKYVTDAGRGNLYVTLVAF